jgi:hypothetical protein
MSVPMIPVSPNLGGGMMPCFKRQPKPGACTSPACQAKATRKCVHVLDDGKLCGIEVCEKHGDGNLCMPHQRLAGKRAGR